MLHILQPIIQKGIEGLVCIGSNEVKTEVKAHYHFRSILLNYVDLFGGQLHLSIWELN